jgi:endo-1,4-beta-xylanase
MLTLRSSAFAPLAFAAVFVLSQPVGSRAADLPAPRPVPVLPQNTVPNGPAIPTTPPTESAHPSAVLLWPEGAPGSEARKGEPENIGWRQESDIVFPIISNIHNPSLTPFLPAKGKATGCAVIIAPGGGHMFHTIDREGYDLGKWLADHGVAAFVLKYRLQRDQATPAGAPQPYKVEIHALADANRAIRLIRAHATEWNVNPAHVGILGFSAGGEVAILAALHSDAGKADAIDPVERQSSRPDFFAPIYPGGLRADLAVSKDTPPAFLLCATDDRMPDQLTAFFNNLRKAGVNAELHIYNSGGHGFGVRERPIAVTAWPSRFIEWLGDRGMLKQ